MADEPYRYADSPYRVAAEGGFRPADARSAPPEDAPDKAECRRRLADCVARLDALQRRLHADNRHAVLLVFQAMDAAGKDSTIRAVLTGVDPAGCQVHSFKRPSEEELDHDFLWRHARALPERGRIGVFNRSWYEEVLSVRVHPGHLLRQRLPGEIDAETLWSQRYESIRDFERHLARNGTLVLKFWLNVSSGEQRRRLLARLDEPDKRWKFEAGDLDSRARWEDYMAAYAAALQATSTPWAPWYAIPADSKSYMRWCVADIVVRTLDRLHLAYPAADPELLVQMARYRAALSEPSSGR